MELEQDFAFTFSNLHNKKGRKISKLYFFINLGENHGRKVAAAEEVSVAKGEDLVANVTDTVAMSSPEFINTVVHLFLSVLSLSKHLPCCYL